MMRPPLSRLPALVLYNKVSVMSRITQTQAGVSIIEVVVAVAIIAIMVVTVGFSITSYVNARSQLLNNAKALYLAEEGYEMLRMVRDENWEDISDLTIGDTYGFDVATTSIAIVGAPEVIDGDFTRSFVVGRLIRDTNDDIDLVTGSSIDADGRIVTVTVTGPNGVSSSFEAVLTNIFAI